MAGHNLHSANGHEPDEVSEQAEHAAESFGAYLDALQHDPVAVPPGEGVGQDDARFARDLVRAARSKPNASQLERIWARALEQVIAQEDHVMTVMPATVRQPAKPVVRPRRSARDRAWAALIALFITTFAGVMLLANRPTNSTTAIALASGEARAIAAEHTPTHTRTPSRTPAFVENAFGFPVTIVFGTPGALPAQWPTPDGTQAIAQHPFYVLPVAPTLFLATPFVTPPVANPPGSPTLVPTAIEPPPTRTPIPLLSPTPIVLQGENLLSTGETVYEAMLVNLLGQYAGAREIVISVAQLPELGFTLPLEEGTTVVGGRTVITQQNTLTNIYLNMPQSSTAAIVSENFRETLTANGWLDITEPGMRRPRSAEGQGTYERLALCEPNTQTFMLITAEDDPNSTVLVDVQVDTNSFLCDAYGSATLAPLATPANPGPPDVRVVGASGNPMALLFRAFYSVGSDLESIGFFPQSRPSEDDAAPAPITTPPEAEIIGTLLRETRFTYTAYTIFRTEQSLEEISAYYDRSLAAQWQQQDDLHGLAYCYNGDFAIASIMPTIDAYLLYVYVGANVPCEASIERTSEQRFENGITLLSAYADYDASTIDARFNIYLTWLFAQPLAEHSIRFVQVLNSTGEVVAQEDIDLGGRRTGEFYHDTLRLSAADLLPGSYQIVVGWYTQSDINRFCVVDANGACTGETSLNANTVVIPPLVE